MDNTKQEYKTEIITDMKIKNNFFAKVEVVGDSKVGKTSIIKRLINNTFTDDYNPTKGYEFFSYMVKIDGKYIKFQIWDMSSEEDYRPALLNLYRNAHVGILVYSIADYNSFKNLEKWIKDLKNSAPDSKIILIGNKSDLDEDRTVSFDEGKDICKKYNLDLFLEMSSKEEIQSPNFIEKISSLLYEEFLFAPSTSILQEKSESIRLDNTSLNKRQRKCCT